MKKLPIGLVIEGNSTASALLRLPAITSELGPIKSSGLQVATRVSNFLDGGYGVANYNELSSARTILIRIPDASVDRVISEICKAEMVWQEHAIVLCETWVPTEKLEPLQKLGAAIASLVSLPTGNEKTFVLEGDLAAVRQLRRVIERANVRSIELKQGTKHLLFAATLLCSAIPTPLLLMAQQLLREGGLSGNQLSAVIENLSSEMLAVILKGARMTWGGALAEHLKTTDGEYWTELDATHPQVAKALRTLIELGKDQMAPKLSRGHGA